MLYICSEEMHDDGKGDEREDGNKDDPGSHSRCPCFILMEFRKFGSLSHECFLTNLFSKFVSVKKSDVRRDEKKSEEE